MGDGDGDGSILPLMQSIMQNLLSRDVLYPSLKDITEKVPPAGTHTTLNSAGEAGRAPFRAGNQATETCCQWPFLGGWPPAP